MLRGPQFLPADDTPVVNPSPAANPTPCVFDSVALPPPATGGDGAEHARWFQETIQPHEFELRAYLRGRFPTLHDVDDLVQETYSRILRAREVGRATLTRAYLFVIARNAALDQIRRGRVVSLEDLAETERLAVAADQPDAAEAVSHGQELELLAEAVATLPERCREILILRRYGELSHKEIARRLGIAENTVNAQLVTGMMRCRDYLRARGVKPERSHADKPT